MLGLKLNHVSKSGPRSQQIFAQDTTAQLSCHVQNFVDITLLEFG